MSESEINVSKWKNKINFVISLKAASTTVNKEKKTGNSTSNKKEVISTQHTQLQKLSN